MHKVVCFILFGIWNTSKLAKRFHLFEKILLKHPVHFDSGAQFSHLKCEKEKLGHRNVEHEAFSGHTKSLQLYRFILQPV